MQYCLLVNYYPIYMKPINTNCFSELFMKSVLVISYWLISG